MADPMRLLSNSDLTHLIESFAEYLTCWKVGLQYGSQMVFDMGPMFEHQLKPGLPVTEGSCELILEGYDWKIFDRMRDLIASSDTVSEEIVRDRIDPAFLKTVLQSVKFNRQNKELFIEFSNGLLIASAAQLSGEYVDDTLCILVLPDGRVLSCDARKGFYWDGSISEEHAERYAKA